jgi:hypothetical protein
MKKYFIISMLFCLFFGLKTVQASSLTFSANDKVSVGTIFTKDIILNSQGKDINAIEIKINYPQELLKVKDLSTGGSILSIWPTYPTAKNGQINLVGGAPNGNKGKDLKIISIVFEAIKEGEANIAFDKKSKIVLNNGKGTQDKLSLQNSFIEISGRSGQDNWKKILDNDKISPENFLIKLAKDQLLFDGKYFISFFTTDKETGIDYYEVAETKKGPDKWKKQNSPFILSDQALESTIKVKAVDKAGNEHIAILEPQKKHYVLIGLLLLSIFLLWDWYRLRKHMIRKNRMGKKKKN